MATIVEKKKHPAHAFMVQPPYPPGQKKPKSKMKKARVVLAGPVVPVVVKRNGEKKKKRSKRGPASGGPAHSAALKDLADRHLFTMRVGAAWRACLKNPFENEPVRVGDSKGTELITLMSRGQTLSLTNGFGGIALLGCAGNSIILNSTGASTGVSGSWAGSTYGNSSVVTGAGYSGARIIGMGIRWFANNAQTNAPGVCYAGCFPSFSTATQLNAGTYSTIINSPQIETIPGNLSGMVCWTPSDVSDLTFYAGTVQSTAQSTAMPIVVFTGFPALTVINYDCITHMEVINYTATTAYAAPEEQNVSSNDLYDTVLNTLTDWSSVAVNVALDSALKYASGRFVKGMSNMHLTVEAKEPDDRPFTRLEVERRQAIILADLWRQREGKEGPTLDSPPPSPRRKRPSVK